MKKRIALLVMVVILLVSFSVAAAGRQDSRAEDQLRIAFVAPELDITQFFGQFYEGFIDHLEGSGVNYSVTQSAPAGGQEDAAGFDRILTDVLSLQPDFLVHVIGSFELEEPRLVELQEAGVNLIIIDALPDRPTDVDPIAWVITDHVQSGYLTGYGAVEDYHEMGYDHINVSLFHGTAGSEVGIDRMNGYVKGLKEATNDFGMTYEIVNEVWTEFNREMAYNVSQNVAMAHSDLDLIFGANSNTSLGVMEGLRSVGRLGEVNVTGIGGQMEELAAIVRGDILGAAIRLPRNQGAQAAEILLKFNEEGASADIEQVNYGTQVMAKNAEDIFSFFDLSVLDIPEFRRNISEEEWDYWAAQK